MIRIPADVDREDRVIGPLTARQLGILTVTGLVLYGIYSATRDLIPVVAFLIVAVPVGAVAAVLALGQRDGVSLDRLALAALRQRLSAQHQVAAPEGIRPTPEWLAAATDATGNTTAVSPAPLKLPTEGIRDTGVVDLGRDGLAVIAVCSTVNFGLRTATEQEGLVASFGRYLHSLTAPVQVLIRTERLDLSGQIVELRVQAPGLPHPALEQAALEHAEYLDQLSRATDLLRRQVLLILREPILSPADGLALLRTRRTKTGRIDETARHAAEARLARRLNEAVELLSPAGIVVTPLGAGAATSVLAAACNPDSLIPSNAGLAGADEVITTTVDDGWDASGFGNAAFAGDDDFDDFDRSQHR